MNACEAFSTFVTRVLVPTKAQRFTALTSTPKGQAKILDALCHEFEGSLRDTTTYSRDYARLWDRACFVFHSKVGFGVEFPAVEAAYHRLSLEDGWLIVVVDGSAGIFRPEARWDAERLM